MTTLSQSHQFDQVELFSQLNQLKTFFDKIDPRLLEVLGLKPKTKSKRTKGLNALTEAKYFNKEEFSSYCALLNRYKNKSKVTWVEYRNYLMLSLHKALSARGLEVLKVRPKDLGAEKVNVRGVKGSKDRSIWIEPFLMKALKQFVIDNDIGPNDRIFPITTRHFRRVFGDYTPNPNKSSKAIRHTGAVNFYEACKDLLSLQYYLGHVDIRNTIIYAEHVASDEALRANLDAMLQHIKMIS